MRRQLPGNAVNLDLEDIGVYGKEVGEGEYNMVTIATEKRVLNSREADVEFDGRWLLLDKRDFPPSDDKGYVVAYGNGSPEDRDALRRINLDKYDGLVLLMKGWIPKDDICESGIIDIISAPL